MASQTLRIVTAALLITSPASAAALCHPALESAVQADRHSGSPAEPAKQPRPPWKYWQGESKAELGITDQQSGEIEQIFQATMPGLKAIKHKLDRLETALSQTIKDGHADLATVSQQVEQFENTRAELGKGRTLQLYRMRAVLTADQRSKLKAMMDRWEATHRKSSDPAVRR